MDEPVDDPRVLQDLEANDLDRLPWFFKRYAQSLTRVALPRDLPPTTAAAVAVLAGTADVAHTELDLPHLSRLLHLSAGVVRTAARPYGTYMFRAAGSAGGRFPLELYVAVPDARLHHHIERRSGTCPIRSPSSQAAPPESAKPPH